MDKILLHEFISILNRLDDKEYLLSTVAYWAAPTLKGIKPSSLVSFSTKGRNLSYLWEKYKNEVYSSLGLCFFELKSTTQHNLVLFYNFDGLQEHIKGMENMKFLSGMGYDSSATLEQSLLQLKKRFEHICPHEIGIFLGIPVEDVYGFMRHKGKSCIFCSYWKVYHNPERAKNIFQCYDKAKISVIHSVINLDIYKKVSVEAS